MSNSVSRWIKLFLLIALILPLVTNCAKPSIENNLTLIQQQGATIECRIIKHKFGKTCVPLKPQRIVVLDPHATLDSLVVLGIKPVGFASFDHINGKEVIHGVSLDDIKEANSIGNAQQPSLEKVLLLKPDLILATEDNPYQLLTVIAPTVPVPPPNLELPRNEAFFKENLRYVAKVLGEEAKAEEVLSQYQNRIEDLKQGLGNQLEQIEVSVIYYASGLVYTPARKYDATADVLVDTQLDYKLPPAGKTFSIETVDEYDADILIYY
ncbi:ABC transporter substrate-binding protein [Chlorogloeopsis sp. ULAP02]|uniref:ABC transporter substrate-binding protein n=1 Tax=Chlorogloeopsis sp. ULAP02 TaxID=3107926 RepID=UPI0031361FF0